MAQCTLISGYQRFGTKIGSILKTEAVYLSYSWYSSDRLHGIIFQKTENLISKELYLTHSKIIGNRVNSGMISRS
jgi:hypothetical protein